MKPDVDLTLQLFSASLLTEFIPLVSEDYAQKSLGVTAMALQMAAEEWDRAAARRVEENGVLRAIFQEAGPHVTDGTLGERLRAACQESEASLRVRDLDSANDELRSLLIDLHAHVEELDTPEARRIEELIWQELRASTERRALALAPF